MAHHAHQHGRVHGLVQHLVHSGSQATLAVHWVSVGRERQNGHVGRYGWKLQTNLPRDLHAVHVRHDHVDEGHIEQLLIDQAERFGTTVHRGDLRMGPALLQLQLRRIAHKDF